MTRGLQVKVEPDICKRKKGVRNSSSQTPLKGWRPPTSSIKSFRNRLPLYGVRILATTFVSFAILFVGPLL